MKKVFTALLLILLWSSAAHATTWYFGPGGSNTNTCMQAQTRATRKLTYTGVSGAGQCVGAAGTETGADDTVTMTTGSTTESLVDVIPSGSSAGHEFTLKCETHLGCTLNETAAIFNIGFNTASHYIIIRDFIITGGAGAYASGAHTGTPTHDHIQWLYNEWVALPQMALQTTSAAYGTFTGNIVHDVGDSCGEGPGYCHGLYVSLNSDYWTISQNEMYDVDGYGIHVYPDVNAALPVGDLIERNKIHGMGVGGTNGAGILVYGYDHIIKNNLSYSNRAEGILMRSVGNNFVYNNTTYNNGAGGIFRESGVSTTCKNNLTIGDTGTEIAGCTVVGNNVTTGAASTHFASPGTDFSLKVGSSAINGGADLIAVVTDDFTGAARTGTFDVGAFMDSSSGDTVNPTVSSLSPVDNATSVSTGATFSVTFSEAVTASTGSIRLMLSSNDSVVQTFNVATDISGSTTSTISFTPTSPMAGSTAYYVLIDAGALRDAAGNSFGGISLATTWNITTAQAGGAPTVSTLTPANGATSIAVNANLVAVFSEVVNVVSGNFVIKKCSDDSTFESIPIGDAKVTGGGTTTITVNPAGTFAEKTCYYATMASGLVEDIDGNDYAGPTAWSFTVGDFTNPAISTLTPADGATGVAINANIVFVFTEAVTVQTGNIVIKKCSDNSTFETIAIGSGLVTGTTTTTITVNPAGTFANNTCYYIQVAATAIDDLVGNSYAGISSTTVDFTTIDDVDTTDPSVSSLLPLNNSPLISRTADLVIAMAEVVTISTGNIRIRKCSDNSVFETIAVTSNLVTGTGTSTITINPAGVLGAATCYYIQIPRTAFRDATGNYFRGFLNTTDWRLTTVGP